MVEEVVAVLFEEAGPTVLVGYAAGLRVGRIRPLVGHFQEEQIGQLFDVVAIAHPVVAQDVAVVPKFLDDLIYVF